MLSRSPNTLTHLSRRAHAQRRLRRTAVSRQVLCSTNGCTTFMEIDSIANTARCPICGSARRLSQAARSN
jgi:predicted Zn-ribbon and HTH transcriptional regulator